MRPLALIRSDTHYAWNGPSLLIVTTRGECGEDDSLSGYYFRETRFVRTLSLKINGTPPWLCEAARVAPDSLAFTYAHPEIAEYGGGGTGTAGDEPPTDERGIPQRALAVQLRYTLYPDRLIVAVTVTNHSVRPIDCDISWTVDSDFADIQEAQGRRREQQGPIDRQPSDIGLTFAYAHPTLRYRTNITVATHGDWRVTESRITTRVRLDPQKPIDLGLHIEPSAIDGSALPGDGDERAQHARAWRGRFARIAIPQNRLVEEVVRTNIDDVASFPLLEGERDEWLALQAGMPLYPALFGRDTLTAGWQAAWVDRGESLEATLTRLERLQSNRVNDWRDEEPGRLPYQVRQGPLAQLNLNPYAGYYADYASPLMFVISLAHLYAWTGDTAVVRRHWDTARRILEWARTYGDKDGDGYLEYQTRSSKGTKNQGWKDSGDAVIYEDGTPVPAPLGTCELQGYWFSALQLMAVMSWAIGARKEARAYWRSAKSLKARFNRDWWMDDNQCIALAMDPDKRLVPAVSSNIGHCIASGIVSDEHLPAAVERLFAPDMFSGWGIRTLSTNHVSYNPMSYHCGSVWAVEQATIAFGLRRFGFDRQAIELAHALVDLALLYPRCRVPECVGGYARGLAATPAAYPLANTPQLWNAAAFPLLIHTMLGLQPVAPARLLVVSPALPEWLPEVVLEDLRLADARATIRFWRDKSGDSHARIIHKRGTFRLVQQPPPESLYASIRDRFAALADSVVP